MHAREKEEKKNTEHLTSFVKQFVWSLMNERKYEFQLKSQKNITRHQFINRRVPGNSFKSSFKWKNLILKWSSFTLTSKLWHFGIVELVTLLKTSHLSCTLITIWSSHPSEFYNNNENIFVYTTYMFHGSARMNGDFLLEINENAVLYSDQ